MDFLKSKEIKNIDYKVVIPDIVSIETNAPKLKGFYLLRDINYFGNSKYELKLNYKVFTDKNIRVPLDYDFRNNHYQVKGGVWTYSLSKFGARFAFRYDYNEKQMTYNSMINTIPIKINWTHTIGDYLSDLINLDLFLQGVIILNGVAFRYRGKNHVFCSPSLNGKTTFLKNYGSTFEEIISDDYVLVDIRNRKFATTPLLKKVNNHSLSNWYPIEKIYLITNSVGMKDNLCYTAEEFFRMSSMKFSTNMFVKNLIFYYHLEKEINDILVELSALDIFEIYKIENYNYEQLLRD